MSLSKVISNLVVGGMNWEGKQFGVALKNCRVSFCAFLLRRSGWLCASSLGRFVLHDSTGKNTAWKYPDGLMLIDMLKELRCETKQKHQDGR